MASANNSAAIVAGCAMLEEQLKLNVHSLKTLSMLSNTELNLPNLPDEFLILNFTKCDLAGKYINEENLVDITLHNNFPFPLAQGPIFHAPIKQAISLTAGEDVKHIFKFTLDLSESDIEFQPGDTLGIIPHNQSAEVSTVLERVCARESVNERYALSMKQGTLRKNVCIPPYIPTNSTVRHVVETCLDIRTVPKKLFLRVLAEYTADKDEKRRLQELCSRQGARDYSKFILEARTTFIDILEIFPTCCPPVARLFEFLPRLQARPYSIASSPLAGSMADIVFSLPENSCLDDTKPLKGLCTNWMLSVSNIHLQNRSLTEQLSDLKLEKSTECMRTIPLFLRKSNGFSLPKDPTIPLILIGPGTGISPFIGFLQHIQLHLQGSSNTLHSGDIWLFSGCRYSDRDFLYKVDIEQFLESGVLTRFLMAFSREKKEVKYVQDNMKLYSKEFVTQLVDKRSSIFVCGDAKNMATDVWTTIVSLLQTEKGMTEEDAVAFLESLKKEGRYVQDIWI